MLASCSDLLFLSDRFFSGMSLSLTTVLISQDSLDELEMNDYWKEVENIASSERGAGRGDGEADGEAQEEEHQKIPEGRIFSVLYSNAKKSSFLRVLAWVSFDQEKIRLL